MIDPTRITRRRLLGNSARLAAAALASTYMPANVRRALAAATATDGPVGSLQDVKHVVLLMQENRSFDHYFGTMPGVRGFGDAAAMRLSHGKSVFHQPDEQSPDGYLLPFHLDTKTTSAQKMPSTSHAWACQHASWNQAAFRFDSAAVPLPTLPDTVAALKVAEQQSKVLPPPQAPKSDQIVPVQEAGDRHRVRTSS